MAWRGVPKPCLHIGRVDAWALFLEAFLEGALRRFWLFSTKSRYSKSGVLIGRKHYFHILLQKNVSFLAALRQSNLAHSIGRKCKNHFFGSIFLSVFGPQNGTRNQHNFWPSGQNQSWNVSQKMSYFFRKIFQVSFGGLGGGRAKFLQFGLLGR